MTKGTDTQECVSLVKRMSEAITEVKVGNRGDVVHSLWSRHDEDSRKRVARPKTLIIENKSAPACDIDMTGPMEDRRWIGSYTRERIRRHVQMLRCPIRVSCRLGQHIDVA